MSDLPWEPIQRGLTHPWPWVRGLTILALCLLVAVPVGAVLGLLGATYGAAALVALAIGYAMLRSTLASLVVLIGVICLLPFAALPVDIGFSPTLLDLALLVLFFVWVSRLAAHLEGEFVAVPPTVPVLVFVALAVVSFVAGLSHASVTANVLRHFGEILLSVLLFLLVINVVRSEGQLRLLVLALILAGFAAAFIGVILYFAPQTFAIRALSVLRVVRYPSGAGVLRYIEDNPELALRATSTSVDPNVLGGMLIFTTTLAVAQVFAARRVLPLKALLPMVGIMGLCLILTFSRSSFVGLLVAMMLLGVLRYRRMLWIGLALLLGLLLLPPAQVYVQHFFEGVQGQDLATQMRFGEYRDAFTLVARYPWFGVGFAGTPDIDTYLGVSSVYLLIAEEMGVVGLLAFLAALFTFLGRFLATHRRCAPGSSLEPLFLGTCLAVAGAMIGGILDHYLFNLDFPHAAALLWLMVGLGTSAMRLVKE